MLFRSHQQRLGLRDSRATGELHRLLGRGDDWRGSQLLDLFLERFLPPVPDHIERIFALKLPGRGWSRRRGPLTYELLLAHFRGACALGGIFVGVSSSLVLDLDNHAGKSVGLDHHGPIPLDPNLSHRINLARAHQPHALWLRSSESHGLHAWTFLDAPVRIEDLARLALDRLRRVAQRDPEFFRGLTPTHLGGIKGVLEILPPPTKRGQVIRAPFGPGSFLLDSNGKPTHTHPADGLQLLAQALDSGGAVDLSKAFPRDVIAQLPLISTAPVRTVIVSKPRGGEVPRTAADHAYVLRHRCDGRLAPEDRADLPLIASVADHFLETDLPGPGYRHQAAFTIAYALKRRGLTRPAAKEELRRWFTQRASHASAEARQSFSATLGKVLDQVDFVYDYEKRRGSGGAPSPRRRPPSTSRRYRRPAALRQGDHAALEQLLGPDGRALEAGLRLLGFALSNGTPQPDGSLLTPLPARLLQLDRRHGQSVLRILEGAGICRRIRKAIPKRDAFGLKPPQAAQPALWHLSWAYTEAGGSLPLRRSTRDAQARRHGAAFRSRRALPLQLEAQLLSAQGGTPNFGVAVRREGTGTVGSRGYASVYGEISEFSGPCGSCGRRPSDELRRGVQEACGRRFEVELRGEPSTASAASTGTHFMNRETRTGERGSGGEGANSSEAVFLRACGVVGVGESNAWWTLRQAIGAWNDPNIVLVDDRVLARRLIAKWARPPPEKSARKKTRDGKQERGSRACRAIA